MFKKKEKPIYIEINENRLKQLKMFESVDGHYNDLGYYISYTRVTGGIIRTIGNNTALAQLFIPLPAAYFVVV